MSKQTMRQALDALQSCTYDEDGYCLIPDNEDAITALRAALDAPEPYDQQALEPCNVCGWKAIVPGEPCLMCERNAKMLLPEYVPLSDAEIDALGVRGIEQFPNLYNHVPWAGELKMYVRQLARAIEQEARGK